MIKATWCISNNIGDVLTPWLIEKITGQLPLYVPFDVRTPKFMVTGSILNHAVEYTTVWGAGLAEKEHGAKEGVNAVAVRGPLTARQIRMQSGIPVEVVGDPALLMPRFYKPEARQLYEVGICPHYVHQDEFQRWIGDKPIKLLNVFDSPEKFVDDLLSCKVVYSSSLHGLILADAYGIPSHWIEGISPLGGDGMKFTDHLVIRDYLSQSRPAEGENPEVDGYSKLCEYIITPEASLELRIPIIKFHIEQLPKEIDKLRDSIIDNKPPDFTPVCDALWKVCPFRKENS